MRKGGTEGGREGTREEGREGGKEGDRKGGREGRREGSSLQCSQIEQALCTTLQDWQTAVFGSTGQRETARERLDQGERNLTTSTSAIPGGPWRTPGQPLCETGIEQEKLPLEEAERGRETGRHTHSPSTHTTILHTTLQKYTQELMNNSLDNVVM